MLPEYFWSVKLLAMKYFRSLLLILILALAGCNINPKVTDANFEIPKELEIKNPIVYSKAKSFDREVQYKLDSIASAEEKDSLLTSLRTEELETILALNRMDKNRLRTNSAVVIPDCPSSDFKDFSPFPKELDVIKCAPKVVLVSQRIQAFGLYENGELIKWGPVSTGKRSTKTPNGLHYGNYKAKRKVSTVDESWILPFYFNFMNYEGVGTHQYAMPGYPASHGCVRMYNKDAKYIYDWADMWQLENGEIAKNGTPFMVFGEYDYTSNKPWHELRDNLKANSLQEAELQTLNEYMLAYQEDPRNG